MRKLLTMMICAFCSISLVSAQQTKSKNEKVTTKFLIENMDCENCVKKIEKTLSFEKGVTDLKCDLKTKTVAVTYRTDRTSDEKLMTALKKIEKPGKVIENDEKR